MESYDRPAVDGIVSAAKAGDYKILDVRFGHRPQRPLPETLRQESRSRKRQLEQPDFAWQKAGQLIISWQGVIHGQEAEISRRTVLRGIGTAIALPWLESIMPRLSQAAEGGPPRRMAFFSVPDGMHMPDWTPKEEGPLDVLPPILAPLEPLKSSITVLTGLTLDGGRPHRDGPGDHARAAASFLTGAHPYKTSGKDIRNGISVDQAAAEKLGRLTRFASLELGCERSAQAGNCDSGYSCAYSSNISWRTPTSPMSKEVNPRAVFDRLFGPAELTAEDRARRARARTPAEEHSGLRGRGRRRPAAQTRPQRRPQARRVSVRRARDRTPLAEGRSGGGFAARRCGDRPARPRSSPNTCA